METPKYYKLKYNGEHKGKIKLSPEKERDSIEFFELIKKIGLPNKKTK